MGIDNARRLPLALIGLSIAVLAVAAPAAASVPAGGAGIQQLEEEEPGFGDVGDPDADPGMGDDEAPMDAGEDLVVDDQVAAIEQATGELGRAKRAAAGKLARLGGGSSVLRPCLRGGPGWKRIRSIEHAPQRALYIAAARRLLADMKSLLDDQQPRIVAYEPAFERFVADLRAAPVSDATLREAIAAQARRLAGYRELAKVKADCDVFNKLTRRVREFPTRSAAQIVRADYRAAPLARKVERNISNQVTRIGRRQGVTDRDADTLAAAAETLVELGGEPGYATGFQYALSLR